MTTKHFSSYKTMGIFQVFKGCGRVWATFELIQDFMVTIVTSKNDEDSVKIVVTRMATTL